ncbi:MAG: DUF2384 domain-containing protein [Planctomycetes bacterium]|nr:DUF2384 domain-containing protein [Planctomycetota bacterium]
MAIQIQAKKKAKKRRKAKTMPHAASAKAVVPNENLALELRKRLQLGQPVFARLLGLSVRTLATLESGVTPTEAVARRLNEISRLTNAIEEVIISDALGRWLQNPNPAFGGLKPVEVIDRGETDRIWAMVYFLRSGVPV